MNIRILILATRDGPYSYLALKHLVENGISPYGIAIDKRGVGKKSLDIWQERTNGYFNIGHIDEFESSNCPFFEFPTHADKNMKKFIKKHNIDLLVNAGTPCIIKQDLLDAPNIGILNVHPGLLPEYRGCTTMEWSIFNDDPVGNTAHFMSAGIDEGPIIMKESYIFKKSDNYTDIRNQLYEYNLNLMAKSIKKIINEELTLQSLPQQGNGKYWSVIDDDKLSIVKQKLNNGNYKYQN